MTITFKAKYVRTLCNREDFKMFAMEVDVKQYPELTLNSYGNIVICGDLFDLQFGVEYTITAFKEQTKYGYKVINATYDRPKDAESVKTFLYEILTFRQADTILEHYPNILDLIKEERCDEIDLRKLKGIKEKTFAKIKRKIIYNYCLIDLVSEFNGYITLSVIKHLYNQYKSVDKVKYELRKDPYKCLCKISGIGFLRADAILLEIEKVSKENIANGKEPIVDFKEDLKTSLQRCKAALFYLLEKNEESGNTKMNLSDLRTQCITTVNECSDKFVEAVQDDIFYYNKESLDVCLKRTYDVECYIAETLVDGLNNSNKWEVDIEQYRTNNGTTLSDEQLSTINLLCNNNIAILNGSAGTGKTTTVLGCIVMLKNLNKSYELFTPTGKSSKVVSEYTNENASTIHRGLGYLPEGGWKYNKDNKLNTDVIIVDEFSMVDIYLMKALIDAIDFKRTKLLMIGDASQLPSVGCGNIFHDLIQSKVIPSTTLTKVFRYGEGGLMKIATDVRLCQTYLTSSHKNKATSFGDNGDYTFIDIPSDKLIDNTIALYKKLLSTGKTVNDIQVITAINKGEFGTVALNNKIQQVANKNYGSNERIITTQNNIDVSYYVGDLVIQKVNNYKATVVDEYGNEEFYIDHNGEDSTMTAFIANGEMGIIKHIFLSYLVVDYDGVYIKYDKSELVQIGLGYALTTHKVQGSASKIVILLTPNAHTFMLNSNLIYVGLTRMKERCFHLGNIKTVNIAIKKKANLSRNTFMQEVLKSKCIND